MCFNIMINQNLSRTQTAPIKIRKISRYLMINLQIIHLGNQQSRLDSQINPFIKIPLNPMVEQLGIIVFTKINMQIPLRNQRKTFLTEVIT